ncbi:MAG: AI-2E family transporter [Bdellovibrionales bacterium]
MQHEKARKIRSVIVYSASIIAAICLVVYLLGALRELLLPIIVGGLLAYLCKPLLAKRILPWLPNSVRVIILLGVIGGGLAYTAQSIKKSIPSKDERLVLQVRMNYKLHERFNSIMGVDAKTGKGNFVYNMVKDEINPIMSQIYSVLNLTQEQRSDFRKFYRENKETYPNLEKYYEYYRANLKRARIEEKALEAAKKEERSLASATIDAKEEEKGSIILDLLNVVSTWLLTPFVFIFLLFDNGQIMKFFVQLVPNKFFELSLRIVDEVDTAIGNYLRGTLLECSLVGGTIGLGLFVIGIDIKIALTIGAVAGLANAIPFLGPVIGLVVGLGYGLIVEEIAPIIPGIDTGNLFFAIVGTVVVAQLLDNSIFQPIVLGSAVNLHPLVVIIGVMGGSVIFGFAGMLLAIPAIVIFKVVIETLFKEMKAYRII